MAQKGVQHIAQQNNKALPAPSSDQSNKGLYHPHDVRQTLEDRYPGQVSSSMTPSPSTKNVRLAGQRHPETGIVFDQRGFPIFDDIAKFDTKISRAIVNTEKSKSHMRAATKNLRENILNGKVSRNNFNERQLQDIMTGKEGIEDFTWHHQDVGRMKLIPESLHKKQVMLVV